MKVRHIAYYLKEAPFSREELNEKLLWLGFEDCIDLLEWLHIRIEEWVSGEIERSNYLGYYLKDVETENCQELYDHLIMLNLDQCFGLLEWLAIRLKRLRPSIDAASDSAD
jgi:hypothetical protein